MVILFILQSITLVILLVLTFLFIRFKKTVRDLTLREIHNEISNQHQTFRDTLVEIKSENESTNNLFLQEVEKQIADQLKNTVKNFSNKLDKEINLNKKKIDDWLLFIDTFASNEEKLEALESGINKYPDSTELVNKYFSVIRPLMRTDRQIMYKNILERMNKVARIYLDNCDVNDYSEAVKIYNNVLQLGEDFMKNSYSKRVQMTKEQLNRIEKQIVNIKNSKNDEKERLIVELESMEDELDKSFIQKVKILNDIYKNLSKEIIKVLTSNEDIVLKQRYNLNAIYKLELL